MESPLVEGCCHRWIHWKSKEKQKKNWIFKTFDCICEPLFRRCRCVARGFICFGYSWLSWHGNSILNGQNGPNTTIYEFTYGNRTSARPRHRGHSVTRIYWYFLAQKNALLFQCLAAFASLMIVDVMKYTHDYPTEETRERERNNMLPARKRINMFIILNWKLLLGEKFIFQFSRYLFSFYFCFFFFNPLFISLGFYLALFCCLRFFFICFLLFDSRIAYVQKCRTEAKKNRFGY